MFLISIYLLPFLFKSIRASSSPSIRDFQAANTDDETSAFGVIAHNELVTAPRIADVLQHIHTNGSGVHWIDDFETNGSYVFHTFEEWAAAEHAVMGYKANTFAHAASQVVKGNGTTNYSLQDDSTYHHLHPRLDDGHDVPGGVQTDSSDGRHLNALSRFFCYNSGQFGTDTAWSATIKYGCAAIVTHESHGIATWRSERWPAPPPDQRIYSIFYQSSGWWGKNTGELLCTVISNEIMKSFCRAYGGGVGHKRDVTDTGQYLSQGGILRGYDSPVGTPNDKLGKMLWEVRADPNTCHSNANPC